jgi:hypothetical protein
MFYLVLQLPEDCRLAAVFVAGLSLGGTISELVPFFHCSYLLNQSLFDTPITSFAVSCGSNGR